MFCPVTVESVKALLAYLGLRECYLTESVNNQVLMKLQKPIQEGIECDLIDFIFVPEQETTKILEVSEKGVEKTVKRATKTSTHVYEMIFL